MESCRITWHRSICVHVAKPITPALAPANGLMWIDLLLGKLLLLDCSVYVHVYKSYGTPYVYVPYMQSFAPVRPLGFLINELVFAFHLAPRKMFQNVSLPVLQKRSRARARVRVRTQLIAPHFKHRTRLTSSFITFNPVTRCTQRIRDVCAFVRLYHCINVYILPW